METSLEGSTTCFSCRYKVTLLARLEDRVRSTTGSLGWVGSPWAVWPSTRSSPMEALWAWIDWPT